MRFVPLGTEDYKFEFEIKEVKTVKLSGSALHQVKDSNFKQLDENLKALPPEGRKRVRRTEYEYPPDDTDITRKYFI